MWKNFVAKFPICSIATTARQQFFLWYALFRAEHGVDLTLYKQGLLGRTMRDVKYIEYSSSSELRASTD